MNTIRLVCHIPLKQTVAKLVPTCFSPVKSQVSPAQTPGTKMHPTGLPAHSIGLLVETKDLAVEPIVSEADPTDTRMNTMLSSLLTTGFRPNQLAW